MHTPRIHHEIHGDGPETVLLLNGIIMSTRAWKHQIDFLSRRYRVVAHDFRGQGQSDKTPDEGSEGYSYEMHLRDLKALLDGLKIRSAHFVGTSYGSEIGMQFAYRYPSYVRSLVVAGGASHSDALLRRKIAAWRIASRHAVENGLKEDFFHLLAPHNFSAKFIESHPGFLEAQAHYYARLPDDWYRAFDRLCECFYTLAIQNELSGIRAPTLVVAGTQDELKPEPFSRLLAHRIPRAQLCTLAAGHAMVLERADEFNERVLSFLEKHPIYC